MEGDAYYFSRRAAEERLAAMKSADPRARKVHLAMAKAYDERAKAIMPYHPQPIEKAS